MNPNIFQQLEGILAPERLDAYRQDGVSPATTLARYLWNMALCESLYSPLQMAEIALRNSLHHFLSARCKTPAWYDVIPGLPSWQQDQLDDARQKLLQADNLSPGSGAYDLACLDATQGNASEAVEWLKRSTDHLTQLKLQEDPDFDPIRSTPEFLAYFKLLPKS